MLWSWWGCAPGMIRGSSVLRVRAGCRLWGPWSVALEGSTSTVISLGALVVVVLASGGGLRISEELPEFVCLSRLRRCVSFAPPRVALSRLMAESTCLVLVATVSGQVGLHVVRLAAVGYLSRVLRCRVCGVGSALAIPRRYWANASLRDLGPSGLVVCVATGAPCFWLVRPCWCVAIVCGGWCTSCSSSGRV